MNNKTPGNLKSMTAFASAKGEFGAHGWSWELRSVNAKGMDQRLRVPDWLDGLEASLRGVLSKAVARGNVNLTLRVARKEDGSAALHVSDAVLDAMLKAVAQVETRAAETGLDLVPTRASDILTLRGVLDATNADEDNGPLVAHLKDEFNALVSAFLQMRDVEGGALADIMQEQLNTIADLTDQARDLTDARREQTIQTMKTNLAKVAENTDNIDPDRVAQELALIAVKADVTEELDRLKAHIAAARDLIGQGGPVGRKLDFLMQEFNREANTLCSKAQNRELTSVGLELKAVIDQMREQVQNVE
ncbi:MAG: YicC/YloC family endoribonuclease [Paracoccaceae bacterium]